MKDLRETILYWEKELLDNNVRTSPVKVNELLADGFFEFGSSGRLFTKEDCIGEGGVGVIDVSIADFEVFTLSEDTVLAAYKAVSDGKVVLRTSIWSKVTGKWQMVFHQGTKTEHDVDFNRLKTIKW